MSAFNLLFVPLTPVSLWKVGEDIKGTVNALRSSCFICVLSWHRLHTRALQSRRINRPVSEWAAEGDGWK